MTSHSRRTYRVRVTKDHLVFSAGHFITFNGDNCERIHGHNYRLAVEVEDDLDENHYVFDFLLLRDLAKAEADALDHRMLLPTDSPHIRLEHDGSNVVARYKDRHWSFPADECVLLPVTNTTAEALGEYIAQRLLDAITVKGSKTPRSICVEVEECFGQWALVEWSRPQA